jgi:hypothetical protein
MLVMVESLDAFAVARSKSSPRYSDMAETSRGIMPKPAVRASKGRHQMRVRPHLGTRS